MNYVIVDKNRCKACYLCTKECPKKLLNKGTVENSIGNFPVEFTDEKHECIGCTMCAMRCPDIALTVCKG